MRFVVDGNGQLKPCATCGVAQQRRVDALDAFSSRSGVALHQSFENFVTAPDGSVNKKLAECLGASRIFANDPDERWLVIWGDRGCGKSHLCAAVANALIARSVPTLYISAPDLFAALKQAMDLQVATDQESLSSRINIAKTAPVLVLDDLGAEKSSDWTDSVLFEILDARYRNRLPTMIASNVDPDKLERRISSRMQDREFCVVIENPAADFRKRVR